MEFTLEDYVLEYPVEVSYKISDRPESDACENKTVITSIADRNGTSKFIYHLGKKQPYAINNDICLFDYYETKNAIMNQIKADAREKEPAFTQEFVAAKLVAEIAA